VSNTNLFDLTGKTALVTGARRGIGLGIAEALAAAGADIVGVSAQQEPSGSDVQLAVEAQGRKFHGYQVDLADRAAVTDLVADLAAEGRPIDILINNAGSIHRSPAAEHDLDAWDRIVATDLTTPFQLARDLGRTMIERGQGKIIFTASLLSLQGGINVISYAAAKSGIAGLVRGLANEWAPHGVNVNGIVPGYIATDNTAPLRADPVRDKAIRDRIPAGRWGVPADLGGAAVFLASPASDYVQGILLPVDGGWLGR
jgi:2-deoxy-D-gluconate 3-dehydrogenase